MSHVDRVVIHHRTIPLARPFVTAVRRAHSLDVVLVQVIDTDGRSGWGEAPTSWRVTGESIPSVSAALTEVLSPLVVGANVDEPFVTSAAMSRALVHNASARMSLECALFDLAARLAGQTLHEYLGGTRGRVLTDMTVSATTGPDDVDDLMRTSRAHVEEGFATLKVKVGAGGDDVAMLRALRHNVGPHVIVRADANQAWSPEEAVRIIRTLEELDLGLDMIEQPVHRDDIEGLAHVRARVATPITADESVWTRRDLREVVRHEAADVINIKLAKTGGLSEALALAAEAQRHGLGVIVGCMAETSVGVAAGAALASALDERSAYPSRAHDLDGGRWLSASPVRDGASYAPPHVVLSTAAGTGITGLAPEN